jgi:two-component system nitrogen regulation response regulator GlnG
MIEPGHRILFVDDEQDFCAVTAQILQTEGFVPLLAYDGKTALQQLRHQSPEVAVVDMTLPDLNGLELLRQMKALDEDLPVVIMTGQAAIAGAVEAMRATANDYLSKPFHDHELIRAIHRAVAERQFRLKLKHLAHQINLHEKLTEIMGPSNAIGQLIREVGVVAKSNFNVILIGETGSGKEVVAQAIHQVSPRAAGPFVPVDCGAIPETLLEGELFGYEKGAFTGAAGTKRGKFELAEGGTLFLDEILNLPLGSQAKLLRALQERTICRLGGTTPVRIDVRVLVAADKNLEGAAGAGTFRVDLFFRLNEFLLRIPPLRERREDIIYLSKRFLDLTNLELHKFVKGFSEGAVNTLLTHAWPGNVRQLRSTIRRAVLLAEEVITEKHLDIVPANLAGSLNTAGSLFFEFSTGAPPMAKDLLPLREIVAKCTAVAERVAVVEALRGAEGNKAQASRLLHIDYKTLRSKIKRLEIPVNKKRPS